MSEFERDLYRLLNGQVNVSSQADNEVLAWDSSSAFWINQTAAEAGLAAASHTHAHTDISITYGTWSPTLSVTGGTFTSTTVNYARYFTMGKWLCGCIDFQGTTGSSANYVTATPPVTPVSSRNAAGASMLFYSTSAILISNYYSSSVSSWRYYGDSNGGGLPDTAIRIVNWFQYEIA